MNAKELIDFCSKESYYISSLVLNEGNAEDEYRSYSIDRIKILLKNLQLIKEVLVNQNKDFKNRFLDEEIDNLKHYSKENNTNVLSVIELNTLEELLDRMFAILDDLYSYNQIK